MEAFVKLDPTCSWSACWLRILAGGRPVLDFNPAHVSVAPLGNLDGEVAFWLPSFAHKKPSRRRGGPVEGPPALEDQLEAEVADDGGSDAGFECDISSDEPDEAQEELVNSDSDISLGSFVFDSSDSDTSDEAQRQASDEGAPEADTSAEHGVGDASDAQEGEQLDGNSRVAAAGASHLVQPPQPQPQPAQLAQPREAAEGQGGRGDRGSADATVVLPSGCTTSYYSSNGNFQAVCRHPGTQQCRMTRTSKASATAARSGQGRPLGLMAAWCELGHSLPDQAEHKSVVALEWFKQYEIRRGARQTLMACEGADALASFERPRRAGEGLEPEVPP